MRRVNKFTNFHKRGNQITYLMEWLRLALDGRPVDAVVIGLMSQRGIGEGEGNVVEHHDGRDAMIPNQTPKVTAGREERQK